MKAQTETEQAGKSDFRVTDSFKDPDCGTDRSHLHGAAFANRESLGSPGCTGNSGQ